MGYVHTFYEEVKFSKMKGIMQEKERNYHNNTNLHLQYLTFQVVLRTLAFA